MIRLRSPKVKWALSLGALALLAATMTVLLTRPPAPEPPVEPPAVPPVAIARTNLVLVAGRLHLSGRTNAFTGIMLDHTPDGSMLSRSFVSNGLLHGLSEGWHTNGQLQVSEHFQEGASHGLRTKWSAQGNKISEAVIVAGRLHGPFRRWHENGALAEQMEMQDGQADGVAKAYFPSGSLKSEIALQSGKVIGQKFWKDGESKEATAESATPPLTSP